MSVSRERRTPPRVLVIADVEATARSLIDHILKPGGIQAWGTDATAPPADILLVDITQLRGDPLAGLRTRREAGDEAPAIVLAAHFPTARLRDLFHLNVADILLKPYRPVDLCQAIFELAESRSAETNTAMLTRSLESTREQARRRTEEIRLLSEIGRAVAGLADLEAILARVVEAAVFVADAEEASIYLADPETNELALRASHQAGQRQATLQRLRVNDTLVGQVYQTGQAILRQPSVEGEVKVQTGFLVQALINVPIRVRSDVVGVLSAYNRTAPRAFTEHHVTVLSALADWAGVGLEHAQLLERVQNAAPPTPVTAAPHEVIDGIDRALAALEPLADGPAAGNGQREIRAAVNELRSLRERPLALLTPAQAMTLVDVTALLRQVVHELTPVASRRGLELVADLGPGIPLIAGDRGRLVQVIGGLTASAIRRTQRGRVVLDAHTFAVRGGQADSTSPPEYVFLHDGAWLAITVGDTSSGLSPDTIRALTAPVVEAGAGELGPGLAMGEVRQVVESLDGVMWHEQTPAGTIVTVALPAG
ncbi:MAG TPA: GAF domain-containing protein [Anaerolineales bacterium]|nr:GAF domain-containing protein [Anaerolineales bacterium]